jgi:hypothetical protein
MDTLLTVLVYEYVGLAFSAPLLVIPAMLICRKLANPWWKSLVILIPLLGLPLFSLILKLPRIPQSKTT